MQISQPLALPEFERHLAATFAYPLPDDAPPYPYQPRPQTAPLPAFAPLPFDHVQLSAEPTSGPLYTLGAAQIARLVAARQISVEDVARAVLDRIAATDDVLQAWVCVDREYVLAEARRLDAEMAAGRLPGPLCGVPVGVKDIYDVAGLPTRAGSRSRQQIAPAVQDSALVARLRAAGALIVGKTATTEFAYADPAPTRNPWNLEHTPGGSSSGSAAVVAARVVPVALGTQTVGSVLRPAAFCGVVGFKPTWGRLALDGVVPLAWSLDTAGWLTRTVEDAALVWHAVTGDTGAWPLRARQPRRVVLWHDPFAGQPAPELAMQETLANAAQRLADASVLVTRRADPVLRPALHAHQLVLAVEAATAHGQGAAQARDLLGQRIAALIETGLALPGVAYLQAQRVRTVARESVLQALAQADAGLTAAAPGPAPASMDSTGNAAFNAPWTFSGVPAITLNAGRDRQGLPLGIQLVGRPGEETALLEVARWCEELFGPAEAPPGYA